MFLPCILWMFSFCYKKVIYYILVLDLQTLLRIQELLRETFFDNFVIFFLTSRFLLLKICLVEGSPSESLLGLPGIFCGHQWLKPS